LTKELTDRPRDIGDLRRELAAIASGLSSSGIQSPTAAPSLAVLYFENLANDSESEYFCAGITEDILTDLSKIRGLRVASRNAVSKFRGTPVDIPRIASELGVGAVLEGSVRRSGDRVRISAQLINAADGFHMWAERYDRTLQDVFAVQEEIASSIASALKVALTPVESETLVKGRPNDARAYDLYLKGRQLYGQYNEGALRQALSVFKQATSIDPNYALAYAGIGDCYGQLLQWGAKEDAQTLARLGLESARRAIALDPRLPEGHKAEGLVLRFSGDRAGSRAALLRAVEVDPRFAPALINLAVESYCRADVAGTERLVRRVIELDPQDAFATTWLAFLMVDTDRVDEVLSLAERLRRLTGDPFYVTASHVLRAMGHLRRHDVAAVERDVREAKADGADSANLRTIEAMVAARTGGDDEAKAILSELEHVSTIGSGALVVAAGTAVRVGDSPCALRFLGRRLVADLAPTLARLDPVLHPLLDHAPLAPRRRDAALIWPLEAPAIDAARHALFREVKIESGVPKGSDVIGA
jgi:TolB-like protein/Flp pilus assembly protein TadD